MRTTFLEATAHRERMQMPFGTHQHVQQIRAYAATAEANAQGSRSKELVTLLHRTADDLEIISRLMFTALGTGPTHLSWLPGPPEPRRPPD